MRALLNPKTGVNDAVRSRLRDWGDRLVCGALLGAGLGGFALLGWYVLHMPALR